MRARARHDADQCAVDRKLAAILCLGPLRVTEIVEPIEQLLLRHVVAAPKLERPREDPGQHPVALAVQARIDHPREHHVVIAGERAGHDEQDRDGDKGVLRRARVGRRHPASATPHCRERATLRSVSPRFGRWHQSVSTQ